jgi:hypothetical protein
MFADDCGRQSAGTAARAFVPLSGTTAAPGAPLCGRRELVRQRYVVEGATVANW